MKTNCNLYNKTFKMNSSFCLVGTKQYMIHLWHFICLFFWQDFFSPSKDLSVTFLMNKTVCNQSTEQVLGNLLLLYFNLRYIYFHKKISKQLPDWQRKRPPHPSSRGQTWVEIHACVRVELPVQGWPPNWEKTAMKRICVCNHHRYHYTHCNCTWNCEKLWEMINGDIQ